MGMNSATKKISIAVDGHEDMDTSDGSAGEMLCVRALFKDESKTIETRSKENESKCIETRSKDNKSKDDIKSDRQDVSKNFKNRKFMGQKPAEVFRTDFITAMKLPEFHQFAAGDYLTLTDTWRQEWEKGVQVPVNPEKIPKPAVRKLKSIVYNKDSPPFDLPSQRINFNEKGYVSAFDRSTTSCDYDLDDIDVNWLKDLKSLRSPKKANKIDELTMERAVTWFERQCFDKMAHEVATKEGLSIEYDETTTCHVCLSPDAEDGNEIIFCDACNMCAHQHCYGVLEIPEGNWLCNPCSRGNLSPPCCLCPNKGGAMKRMKDSLEWIHVICAWWVPEVKIEDTRFIERITKDKIPTNRWNLTCSICWEKTGACIQCSVKRCVRAYHITCAVKCGLEMKTVVDPEKDDVQHISFCSKHCTPVPPEIDPHSNQTGEDVENNRLRELRKLQSEFYTLVSVNKASRELRLTKEVTKKMLSYWTMKRRHNNNQSLIPLTMEQEEKLSGKQGVVLLHQQRTLEMERFLHLRQDLERLRNLCYMIVRREKMRKELHRSSIDIFLKQNDILLDENEDLSGDNIDFIRHRTTNFAKFSENYETEKEYRNIHGSHLKLFNDSSTEEEDLLKSNIIERVNPQDFDRPLCTKVENKKPQSQKTNAKDTPKIPAKKNIPATDAKKPVSIRKPKKFTIPPTRRSSRLDILVDISTTYSIENDVTSAETGIGNFCCEEVTVENSDTISICSETTANTNEMDSERNIFEVTNVLIETEKSETMGTDTTETMGTDTTETMETDTNGTIKTDTNGNIKADTNGMMEMERTEWIETETTGTIETDTNNTDCSESKEEKMERETNLSPKTVSEVITTHKTEGKTNDSPEKSGAEESFHVVPKTDEMEVETNGTIVEPLSRTNIFVVIDEKMESTDAVTENTNSERNSCETSNEPTESETNISSMKSNTDRNIFELLSPKKEDSDYSPWSVSNDIPHVSCESSRNEVEDHMKHIVSNNTSLLTHVANEIKSDTATDGVRTPLTKSSPTEVKENAFDTFNEFLNDEVHQNGFSTFSHENNYDEEMDRKCDITSLKPIPNNFSKASLFKRKNKRFRNILKYEGKARRNSPRLHQRCELVDTTSDNTQLVSPVSPTKGSLERLSKLIIETKRRRLNSLSDYPTDIKDEPPDYVRITRSRGVSCSQVTSTA